MNRLLRNRLPIDETLRAKLGTPRIVRRLASSPRSRVLLHRTAVVAALADDNPDFAEIGRLCQDLHDSMRKHWPEIAHQPLPARRIHKS